MSLSPGIHSIIILEYHVKREDFEEIARKTAASSSIKGNPIALQHRDLLKILDQAF